jgi:hypothetical protein
VGFYIILLPICIGLMFGVAACVQLIRARCYYVEPQGLSFLRSRLARYSRANYTPEGVVRVRLALLFFLLFAYASFCCALILWLRFAVI